VRLAARVSWLVVVVVCDAVAWVVVCVALADVADGADVAAGRVIVVVT
jgi:hypothetical protein